MTLKEFVKITCETSVRSVSLRFYTEERTLLLDHEFPSLEAAKLFARHILFQGLKKTSLDSWGYGKCFGPEGYLTQAVEHLPVIGHAVNVAHYAMGKTELFEEGDARTTSITQYVPVLGHLQGMCAQVNQRGVMSDLSQKSYARATGVTATVGVAITAPAVVAAVSAFAAVPAVVGSTAAGAASAAAVGAASSAAGFIAQAATEHLIVEERNQERANKPFKKFVKKVAIGATLGAGCFLLSEGATIVAGTMKPTVLETRVESVVHKCIAAGIMRGVQSSTEVRAIKKFARAEAKKSMLVCRDSRQRIVIHKALKGPMTKAVLDRVRQARRARRRIVGSVSFVPRPMLM